MCLFHAPMPPTPLRIFIFFSSFFFFSFWRFSGWNQSKILHQLRWLVSYRRFPRKKYEYDIDKQGGLQSLQKRLPFALPGSWCNAEHGSVPDGEPAVGRCQSILSDCQNGHHARKEKRWLGKGWVWRQRLVWERMKASWWWGACFLPSQNWVDLPSLVGNLSLC